MKKVRRQHFGSTIKGKITIYAAISMVVMIAITALINRIVLTRCGYAIKKIYKNKII